MFTGYVQLEATLRSVLLVVDGSDSPINADALPDFRVYGPNGFVESGSCTFLDSGNITDATNAAPIVVTSSGHGLQTGDRVTITGVTGNTAANGTFDITVTSQDAFSLDGSSGSGSYASGGVWNIVGAYDYTINALGSSGYDLGEHYSVLFDYKVSSVQKGQVDTFLVN